MSLRPIRRVNAAYSAENRQARTPMDSGLLNTLLPRGQEPIQVASAISLVR